MKIHWKRICGASAVIIMKAIKEDEPVYIYGGVYNLVDALIAATPRNKTLISRGNEQIIHDAYKFMQKYYIERNNNPEQWENEVFVRNQFYKHWLIQGVDLNDK